MGNSRDVDAEAATCTIIKGFVSPSGAGVDPTTGHIAISEYSCVTWLDKDTFQVLRRAGKQNATGTKDGKVTEARFQKCCAVTFDDMGHAVVTDHCRVRMLSFDGRVVTWAGQTPGCRNGPAASALFGPLSGISMGSSGLWYVADHDNHMIRRLTSKGNVVAVAGNIQRGCKDGPKGEARFSNPAGITLGADKSLYVCDSSNHCIRKIDHQGNVTTYAGTPNTAGRVDGDRLAAKFSKPYGITTDPSGTLYITERGTNAVRAITPDGTVSTLLTGTEPLLAEGEGGIEPVTLRHLGHPVVTDRYQLLVPDVWLGALLIFDLDHPDVPRDILNAHQTPSPAAATAAALHGVVSSDRASDSRIVSDQRSGSSYKGAAAAAAAAAARYKSPAVAAAARRRAAATPRAGSQLLLPSTYPAEPDEPEPEAPDAYADANLAKVEAWIQHQMDADDSPTAAAAAAAAGTYDPVAYGQPMLQPVDYPDPGLSPEPPGTDGPYDGRPPTPFDYGAVSSPGSLPSVPTMHSHPTATASHAPSRHSAASPQPPPAHSPSPLPAGAGMATTSLQTAPAAVAASGTPTGATGGGETTSMRTSIFNRLLSSSHHSGGAAAASSGSGGALVSGVALSAELAPAQREKSSIKDHFRRPRRRSFSGMSDYTVQDTPHVVVPPGAVQGGKADAAEQAKEKPKSKAKKGLRKLLCGFLS